MGRQCRIPRVVSTEPLNLAPPSVLHASVTPACVYAAYGVRAYLQAVVCKLIGSPMPPLDTAAAVVRHVEASPHGLAEDPLGFYPRKPEAAVAATTTAAAAGAGAEALQPPPTLHEDTTLRVVFEARAGSTRNIRNLHQVMEACDKWGADFKGAYVRRC